MEIDVTCLVNDADPAEISASIAERGQNAAKETWEFAKAYAATERLLTTTEQQGTAREFFKGFGAWEDDEIAGWSDVELDALVLQFAAGDLRELQRLAPGEGLGDIDWTEAEKLSEEGTCGGRLFVADDKLYIYIGD